MIVADLGVFVDALEFVVDERALILEKTWEHLLLSGAAMAVALASPCPLGVCSATSTAAPSSRSTSRTSAARCRASP